MTTGSTFSDVNLKPATTYSYAVVAADDSGDTAQSSMVSATTPGLVRQWIANQSVEANATGWSGVYNSTSVTTRVSPGFDGNFSLRSVNKSPKSGSNGFNDKPHWIPGVGSGSTVARTVYTGSVWVKADVAGEKLTLFLRELNAAGAPVNKAPYNVGVTVTASSTGWFNISEAYPAVAAGDASVSSSSRQMCLRGRALPPI